MKTPEEVARNVFSEWARGAGADDFSLTADACHSLMGRIAAAIAAERQRADALAEALRDALAAFNNYDDYLVAGIMERALSTYDSAAGGSGHRAALPAQESPAGGDFPPTTGRAGD